MTGSFEFTPGGEVVIEQDGRLVLDTSLPLMQLLPSETIALTAHDIVFPSLWHGTIYNQITVGSGISQTFSCAVWAGLIEQEWGPAAGSPNTLTDEVVGTVPPGIDYLDVFLNLHRTVTPPGWMDLPMRSNIPQNEWVKIEGGSCQIEEINGMRRLFEIVLDPAGSPAATRNVLLRRYQSVTANGQVGRFFTTGTGNSLGYIAGTNAPAGSVLLASYGALLQTKGPHGNLNHRPGGQDPCTTAGTNYASTWTGDIVIKPGRIGA